MIREEVSNVVIKELHYTCGRHIPKRKYTASTKCPIQDCERPVKSKGLCILHYQQKLRKRGVFTVIEV